jgi:hypothetical protein
MLPMKLVPVPSVAEEPIRQNTLHARAPLMSSTAELDAVVMVDPIWKTNCAFGLPWASSVSVPVRPIDEEAK